MASWLVHLAADQGFEPWPRTLFSVLLGKDTLLSECLSRSKCIHLNFLETFLQTSFAAEECRNIYNLKLRPTETLVLITDPGVGGYSQKNWVGVCGSLATTLTLFMTKISDIPYPIYDLTKNLKPYYMT